MFVSSIPNVAGLVRSAGDPDATRTVYTIVVVLLAIGVVLVGVGIWVIRQTRSDPELLAPLEQMDTRAWRKRDPAGRQRMLDDVRPDGATPVRAAPDEPDVDDDFELPEKRVPTFADLEAVAQADESVAASDGADGDADPGDDADEAEATGDAAVEEDAKGDDPSDDVAVDGEPAETEHIDAVEAEPVESDR